jgi:hypothetical protein
MPGFYLPLSKEALISLASQTHTDKPVTLAPYRPPSAIITVITEFNRQRAEQ